MAKLLNDNEMEDLEVQRRQLHQNLTIRRMNIPDKLIDKRLPHCRRYVPLCSAKILFSKLSREQKVQRLSGWQIFSLSGSPDLPNLRQLTMAPTRDRNGDSDRATKRKRDKAEAEEERRNSKKQKSKRKSFPEQNGQPDDDGVPTPQPVEVQSGDDVSNPSGLQLVRQGDTYGQLETVSSTSAWSVSKPIGGRMLDIDPVFSVDEV